MSWDKPPTKVDSAVVSTLPQKRYIITATTKTGEVALEFTEAQWRKLWDSAEWIQRPR
jgi:hypothetical protein